MGNTAARAGLNEPDYTSSSDQRTVIPESLLKRRKNIWKVIFATVLFSVLTSSPSFCSIAWTAGK